MVRHLNLEGIQARLQKDEQDIRQLLEGAVRLKQWRKHTQARREGIVALP